MPLLPRGLACAGLLAVAVGSGCQLVPTTRLVACEAQNRALLEQNKAQLAEIENLKAHDRRLAEQMAATEEELAVLERRSELDRHRLANFEKERAQVHRQLRGMVRGEQRSQAGLQWK